MSFLVTHPHPVCSSQNHHLLLEELLSLGKLQHPIKLKLQQACYITCIINWDYIAVLILFEQFLGEYCFEKVLYCLSKGGANPMSVGGYRADTPE